MNRYLPAAYASAAVIRHVLTSELNLMPPVRYVLTETPAGRAYLFAVMDEQNIGKSIARYTNPQIIHQLSTALKGRPVKLSNTTGLRYAVELSPAREIPQNSVYEGSGEGLINIGVTGPQEALLLDPQDMQNILLVGDTGSGKSNLLRLIALAALENGFDVILADPEENTFGGAYWDSVSMLGYVAGSKADFIEVLNKFAQILNERKRLYQSVTTGLISPNTLGEYNALAETPLRRVLLIADEVNSFLDDPAINDRLFELARRARKWGINLVLAGHSWRGRDISTSVRSMLATRIALKVQEKESATTVIGDNQWAKKALKFTHPGRAVMRYKGKFMVFQCHFIPKNYRETGGKPGISNPKLETLIRASMNRQGDDKNKMDIVFAMTTLQESKRLISSLLEQMEETGLIEKVASRSNARFLTQKAIDLINL